MLFKHKCVLPLASRQGRHGLRDGWGPSALALVAIASSIIGAARPARALTVRQALNTTQFVRSGDGSVLGQISSYISVAPDGAHYVIRLLKGDVDRNGDWITVLVGGTQSMAAARPQVVWRKFTSAYDHAWRQQSLMAGDNRIVWIDNRHVAFRWNDLHGVVQVLEINIHTRRAKYLSHCPTDVGAFEASRGTMIVMACDTPRVGPGVRGEVEGPQGGQYVTTTDAIEAIRGNLVGGNWIDEMWNRDLFLLGVRTGAQTRLHLRLRGEMLFSPRLSPDGHYEIVDAWGGTPSPAWRAYATGKEFYLSLFLKAALRSGESALGRELSQLFLVDVRSGVSRPLWDAPTFQPASRVKMAWAPDSQELVVGPAVLPLADTDVATAADPVLATVNVQSGRVLRLPISERTLSQLTALAWPRADTIEARTRDAELRFRRVGTRWTLRSRSPLPAAPQSVVRLEIRQSLNMPPKLYAVDVESGQRRLVLDPNPGLLSRISLGGVRYVHWRVQGQAPASGTLYYPMPYRAGHRYPLVIQICPYSLGQQRRFQLYGCTKYPGLGPSPAIYAARMLASRGMFVLNALDSAPGPGRPKAANIRMYAAAARKLSAEGLIDASRVGIAGHSLPGLLVEESITESNFPYAAAISSASSDTGYLDRILQPDGSDAAAHAFTGKGIAWFLENSPTFNADRIHAALLLVDDELPDAGLLWKWELYAQLRALHAPGAYYVVPHVHRGSHVTKNPGQLMAIKQTAVDWFDFWLNGHEDPAPDKALQYQYWTRLRRQREALVRAPRPPLLRWVATPVQGGPQHGGG